MPGPTFVDLFCGIGGFSLGCIQAGFRQIAAYDIEQPMVDGYRESLSTLQKDVLARQCDLSKATAADILKDTKSVRPDLVVGGPPCQGFSFMGKRNPNDHRSELTLQFARLVVDLAPRAFAMENVPGIHSMGTIAQDALALLMEGGYENAEWLQVDASNFGVPQRRKRALLMGSRAGVAPTLAELVPQGVASVTVRQALQGVPLPKKKDKLEDDPFVPYRKNARFPPRSYAEEMRSKHGKVTGCQLTVHDEKTVRHFATLEYGEVDAKSSSRRLDPHGLAFTLRAGTRSRTACRPVHYQHDRVITVREAARLHSFPDWYDFSEIVSLAHVQIGNSVPPRMARAVVAWIRQAALSDAEEPRHALAAAV